MFFVIIFPVITDPRRAELKYLVQRQQEEIRTINEVGRLLRSTTDPQEVVRLIASYLKEALPLALCAVLVIEQQQMHLVQFAKIAQVDLAAAVRQLCGKMNEAPPGAMAEERLTRIVEDHSTQSGPWSQATIGYLRSSHFSFLMSNGKPTGVVGIFSGKERAFSKEDEHMVDIVADQLTAALRNAFLLEELRRADRMKNDLLSLISHELRIPLAVIQEGTALLLDGVLGPVGSEQVDFLKTVQRNTARLLELIEEVETATQFITGRMVYTFQEADVADILKETFESQQKEAIDKGVTLEVLDPRSSLLYPCHVDAKRLRYCLGHLVENAIQATPSGEKVTGNLSLLPNDIVEIQITDTGAGIPAEELPRLFEQFHMVGGLDHRKTGGLGLGLFMAKKIIDAHRGTLSLENQAGKGIRAIVRLPKEQTA